MEEVEPENGENTTENDYHFIYSMTSGVGALIAGIILIILLCIKAYKSLFQRIFMAIVLLVLLKHVCIIITYENCTHLSNKASSVLVCVLFSSFVMWYSWSIDLFFTAMMLHFLITLCFKTRENASIIVERYKSSKLLRLSFETVIILGSILGPATFYYIPCLFYNHPIPLCRLLRNFSNVSKTSAQAADYFYGYTHSLLTLVTAVIVILGTSMLYCTTKLSSARRMVKKVVTFCLVIIVYLVIQTVVSILVTFMEIPEQLLVFFRVVSALSNYVIIIGFMVTFHFSNLCDPLKKLCKKKQRNTNGNQERGHRTREYGTFRLSSRRTAPSTTYYNLSYTGEFTAISK